jgi:glycosyltransferase involved in cell wall biosynthesis
VSKGRIIHVAGIRLTRETGMGRIACEWGEAFTRRGYDFHHVGLDEVPMPFHNALWPWKARSWIERQRWDIDSAIWLVHEPASGIFVAEGRKVCIFSHGIERRGQELDEPPAKSVTQVIRSLVTKPLWSAYDRNSDKGLRRGWRLALSNQEDAAYARSVYGRTDEDILVFRNGVDPVDHLDTNGDSRRATILFVASWLRRKGIALLPKAAESLASAGGNIKWVLAGVGQSRSDVLKSFPAGLHDDITVIEHFEREDEAAIYQDADIFVLPTFFEGQPLALLQAMAHCLCCITTDNCGQRDLIDSGTNGILFPAGDADAFVGALRSALADEQLRKRLGREAAGSVADRDWKRVSDEFVDWIEH